MCFEGIDLCFDPGTSIAPGAFEVVSPDAVQVTVPPPIGPVDFIPFGDTWKYLDDGSDQGTSWRSSSFDDATWASGESELGFGDGDEATEIEGGPRNNRFRTTYFRRDFEVAGAASFASLDVELVRDDGAVVYINGIEVLRSNMPSGTIDYRTRASSAASGSEEDEVHTFTIAADLLVDGTNVIAVEVHQRGSRSSDLSFNLALTGIS